MFDSRLHTPWLTLRLVYGLVPIVAGLDKFTNLLTDWTQYVNPILAGILPFSASTFMAIVGIIEIAAGVLVLTKYTRHAAYVVSAWLVLIAVNLLFTGKYFDVAARDVVMAAGAYVLAKLSEVRGTSQAKEAAPSLNAARTSS